MKCTADEPLKLLSNKLPYAPSSTAGSSIPEPAVANCLSSRDWQNSRCPAHTPRSGRRIILNDGDWPSDHGEPDRGDGVDMHLKST